MTATPPAVGDTAPAFTLLDADEKSVSLSDYAGRQVVVYFYPAALTPGCTTEACEFTSARTALAGAGIDVIGISPDSPAKLRSFREKENLNITLLSDPDKEVLAAWGAFGEKQNYGKTVMGVIRSTFLVGADGTIVQAWRNVKATGHVARVLKQLGVDG